MPKPLEPHLACSSPSPPWPRSLWRASGCGTSTADAARGRVLFIQKCGVCHTLAQAGTTAQIGPNLDDAFAAAREAGEGGDTVEGIVKAQVEFPRPEQQRPRGLDAARTSSPARTSRTSPPTSARYAGVPGAAPPKVPGGPGAQVFANNGCGGCHTLAAAESGGVTGPNLDEVLPGQSAAMIEESIVDPNAHIAKGYPANVMPQNFSDDHQPERNRTAGRVPDRPRPPRAAARRARAAEPQRPRAAAGIIT